ncbi:FG-GAP-like repeat-containing protein [Streptomyces sp. Ag109_O5-10]|uniref:FG-GAP-like repeat-containing protein n=1 Tax=Streptomyces sp. Ag109_O5-10 TaxID=1855349 RepID=UPI00089BA09C|nr:FG-GAP-like repeat-containing protein [Streptomyces sp. Ag109_O5-10]SEE85651.1 FlgD Ig-like domain-containing protein [Streptomyces sp. Ag109_O5-10]
MARRTTARGVVAALAVLTVVAGPGPLVGTADAGDGTGSTARATEKVFQSDRYQPRADRLYSAGTDGYLHAQEGRSGYLWTSYATGATTELGELPRVEFAGYLGSSSDIVTDVVSPTQKVVLRDLSAATSTDVTLTHGTYMATYGTHVLTQARDTGGSRTLWLYGGDAPADGTLVDGWPAGITSNFRVLGGDSGTAVVGYALGGVQHLALVDLAAAKVTGDVTLSAAPAAVALSADRLVWYPSGTTPTAHVLDRGDLTAPGTTVPLPGTEGTPSVGIAGDWLVVARTVPSNPSNLADESGEQLMAVPVTGGAPVTLLRHANSSVVPAPDGGLLVVGGADAGHWAVRRVTGTGADTPALTELTAVPPVAAKITRLSLENGTLATDEANSSFLGAYYTRPIAADGTPGTRTWEKWDGLDTGPYATGDGRAVTFTADADPVGSYVQSVDRDDQAGFFYLPSATGTVLDVTGRYAVVNGSFPSKQYVGDLGVYTDLQPVLTRSVTAASVWGSSLWTPGSGNGVVTARNLKTGATAATVSTGAPCVPKELQVVSRWIYWSCGTGGTAGVWDRTAKKNIPVPSGQVQLGDGYLVRQDTTTGTLLLTAFADGTATTREIADLPAGTSGGRGTTWTVDKFGGPVAYVDAENRIHLVPSGVATQPLSAVESETTGNAGENSAADSPWWQWRGLLSKPAASWTATLTSKATGTVVRTLSGGAVQGNLTARWDIRDAKGALVPNGAYTFTVTIPPADGSGRALTVSQTVQVSDGAAVRHDFTSAGSWAPDGTGDILTLSSSGTVSYRPGTGTGTLGKAMSASGWPASVKLFPFGDLDGDRRNDILVRFSSGELRVYRTMLGQAFLTSTPHTSLGKGWNQYDVLTSPGDISGDGRPDLIARNSATGAVYLYRGTSTGKLTARVKLYADWKTYKKIVGVGDLNGDGIGDLVAQDKSNNLYRYLGTGKGTFSARVKLSSSWGGSYDTVIGAGDLTGDGNADLLSRDTSGNLWRNNGNGKGVFGARTKIATGWRGYKGIF